MYLSYISMARKRDRNRHGKKEIKKFRHLWGSLYVSQWAHKSAIQSALRPFLFLSFFVSEMVDYSVCYVQGILPYDNVFLSNEAPTVTGDLSTWRHNSISLPSVVTSQSAQYRAPSPGSVKSNSKNDIQHVAYKKLPLHFLHLHLLFEVYDFFTSSLFSIYLPLMMLPSHLSLPLIGFSPSSPVPSS
jgi:hypothetical protein